MSPELPRERATSFDEFGERLSRMFGEESIKHGLAFQPRASDVVISPFAKCGTTWLQQIVHTLRTRGDLEFDDISRVVPWIETALALGLDLDAPQRGEPRAFKSHLPWHLVPKGARYLVAIRDPRDALVSMFRFMEGWFFEPGSISLEEFARRRFLERDGNRDYWAHLVSWWPERDRDGVLLISYEGMQRDPADAVRRVAGFIGLPLDADLLALTLDHSSLEFMLEHKSLFDDRMMRDLSERAAGLPKGGDSSKVRSGRVGSHRLELGADVITELNHAWQEEIEARFGFADYAALEAALQPTGSAA